MSAEEARVRPVLEAIGISKHYGRHLALAQVDLQLQAEETLAVVGPNGAGKTTLIKVLSTATRPTAGQLRIAGYDVAHAPTAARRHIGVVGHQTYLYLELSARENLLFFARLYGIAEPESRADELLRLVDLYARRHEPVGMLSRGMQQRLSLARALVHDPPLLLLDEPDTGLDQQHLALLAALVQGRAIAPRAVVLTTHNLDRALTLCSSLAVLAQGRLVYRSPTAALDSAALHHAYHELAGVAP